MSTYSRQTSPRVAPLPMSSRVTPLPTSSRVAGRPSSPTVAPLARSPTVAPLPMSPRVTPLARSLTVAPLPMSPRVAPLARSPTVAPLPSSNRVPPLPSSPRVPPLPSSPRVPPLPSSPRVPPLPSSPRVAPVPSSPRVSALPSSDKKVTPPKMMPLPITRNGTKKGNSTQVKSGINDNFIKPSEIHKSYGVIDIDGIHVLDIQVSNKSSKKYAITIEYNGTTKTIHYGNSEYQQYQDNTPLKAFSFADHHDDSRRHSYLARSSKIQDYSGLAANNPFSANRYSIITLW